MLKMEQLKMVELPRAEAPSLMALLKTVEQKEGLLSLMDVRRNLGTQGLTWSLRELTPQKFLKLIP